ncbi:hypothetical protein EAG_15609 [Camponotus floridanus]|uniref:Uncharacterized protein n=1 Tax=Camponotus floridanus TaxID=104421 RepID=E2ALV1_CAMFO|nr:hypothetical protein EAG_15609 [Camponotus floridanus]
MNAAANEERDLALQRNEIINGIPHNIAVKDDGSWMKKSYRTGRVETFNSVIAKCTGGKRVNYGLRGSYETRCNAAAVTFNTGKPAPNRVETFNSVITKCTDGKRVNYDLRESYEMRCNATAVTFNTGKPISHLSNVLGTKPGEIAVHFEEKKKTSTHYMRKRSTPQRYVKRAISDKDYGPQAAFRR